MSEEVNGWGREPRCWSMLTLRYYAIYQDADACQQQGGQLCRPSAQGIDNKEAHELGR